MKLIYVPLFAILAVTAFAQDDLLEQAESLQETPETQYVKSTFLATRIINNYSVELTYRNNFQFIIAHRFGRVDEGWRQFFGIDDADMRIGLEYGIFEWWNIGFGRSSVDGIIDLNTRVKFLRQTTGAKKIPLSMVWYSNIGIATKEQPAELDKVHRVSYAHQLMIARKFTKNFSFQIMPTYVHLNVVRDSIQRNDVFSLGFGARYMITRSVSLNAEYFLPLTKLHDDSRYTGSLSFGIDIETGGHVFQVTVTNSRGMIEQLFTVSNSGYWWDKEIHLGFNINRNIAFGGGKGTTPREY